MMVSIRKFCEKDIPYKVKWINDPQNNKYLHYTLPLCEAGTKEWFDRNKNAENRLDMTILYGSEPVGIIGLLNIDKCQKNAELYITVGEQKYKGIGVAGKAIQRLLQIGFRMLCLQDVYLFTEPGNSAAIRAYEKFGFYKTAEVQMPRQDSNCNVTLYRYEIKKENYDMQYGLQGMDSNI